MNKKGIYLSIAAAVISGVSVFINGFAAKSFSNPFIFTSFKNIVVALFLSSIVVALFSIKQMKKLRGRDWLILILIGLIGGSIPFLLFFKGLSLSTSSLAAFIQKTLFIWATIFALYWLKEKITWHHLIGFIALLCGIGLLSPWKSYGFGTGEILILMATFLWAFEAVLIRFLQNSTSYQLQANSSLILSWGRMFFGSVFMLIYLGLIGKIGTIGELGSTQSWWLVLTSVFLLAYVTLWYSSLKHTSVVVATSILAIGFPITVLLNSIFVTEQISGNIVWGLVITLSALLFLLRPIRPIGQI